MNYLICCIEKIMEYEEFFLQNNCLKTDSIKLIPLIKKAHISSGALYNTFLANVPDDAQWLLFCSSAVEFLEDPFSKLPELPTASINSSSALYGPWGARLSHNSLRESLIECVGAITVECPDSGKYVLHNAPPLNKETKRVDTIDTLCLISPATVIKDLELYFQPELTGLIAEDFCLKAASHNIPSHILPINLCYHRNPLLEPNQAKQDRAVINAQQYSNTPKACVHTLFYSEQSFPKPIMVKSQRPRKQSAEIYEKYITTRQVNEPIVVASRFVKEESRVLDIGCAGGDSGVFFSKNLNVELYGMEYDEKSLQIAENKKVYKKLHHLDLNHFNPHEFNQYYRFFDSILLLDVLEHLISPFDVLAKLQTLLNETGTFIVSIPNLAHIYPITNLLKQDFSYLDYGILDSTHLRFFTWRTLARLFAKSGFKVVQCTTTFIPPETGGMVSSPELSKGVLELFLKDKHFFVCQYICELLPCDESYSALKANNKEQLKGSISNNQEGWTTIQKGISLFQNKVNLFNGNGFSAPLREHLMQLVNESRYLDAIYASGLFDEYWYRHVYDEVDFSTIHPMEHYLTKGWREGKEPSPIFSTKVFQHYCNSPDIGEVCPLLIYLTFGIEENLPYNDHCLTASGGASKRYD